jgi:hypothetical protein
MVSVVARISDFFVLRYEILEDIFPVLELNEVSKFRAIDYLYNVKLFLITGACFCLDFSEQTFEIRSKGARPPFKPVNLWQGHCLISHFHNFVKQNTVVRA